MFQNRWWTDRNAFLQALREHGNCRAAAIASTEAGVEVSRQTLRREAGKHGITLTRTAGHRGQSFIDPDEPLPVIDRSEQPMRPIHPVGKPESPGITLTQDGATVTLPQGVQLGDLKALLAARGLDIDDWIVERVVTNEWEALAYGGGPNGQARTVTLHQLKAQLIHRTGFLHAAPDVEQRYIPPARARVDTGSDRLAVVCGDHQAPYFDPDLHAAFLRWLSDVQPDEGVITGDTLDLPTISRHRDKKNWNASAQVCVNSGFRVLSDLRDANPATRWRKIPGNHDDRIQMILMDNLKQLAFVTPAVIDPQATAEPHLYSIRRLLHLDRLGIELVGTEGEDWRYGEVKLAPGLTVRHEPPTNLKAARLGRSIMAGHTHRQAIRYITVYDHNDQPFVREIFEVGCMALTEGGLGFTEHPDWQAGFGTVVIRPDGTHHCELATWRDGVLTWRGERWRP